MNSFINVSPLSGSGNGALAVGGSAHTGRNNRTGTFQVAGAGIASPETVNVIQTGKAEFVSFNNASLSASKNGQVLTIGGKSNSKNLTFSIIQTNGILTLPGSYLAAGLDTNNGADVDGDPGAVAEYSFLISFTIAPNATINDLTDTLKVTANGGQIAQCVVTQTAGDPVLTLSTTSVTIDAAGTAVNVTVTSNTSWEVS